MMEQVFVNLAWQLSTSSLSHLSKVEEGRLFSAQSHIETCVDSSDLNYPDQCHLSGFFFIVYIYWSSDHSEIPDS